MVVVGAVVVVVGAVVTGAELVEVKPAAVVDEDPSEHPPTSTNTTPATSLRGLTRQIVRLDLTNQARTRVRSPSPRPALVNVIRGGSTPTDLFSLNLMLRVLMRLEGRCRCGS